MVVAQCNSPPLGPLQGLVPPPLSSPTHVVPTFHPIGATRTSMAIFALLLLTKKTAVLWRLESLVFMCRFEQNNTVMVDCMRNMEKSYNCRYVQYNMNCRKVRPLAFPSVYGWEISYRRCMNKKKDRGKARKKIIVAFSSDQVRAWKNCWWIRGVLVSALLNAHVVKCLLAAPISSLFSPFLCLSINGGGGNAEILCSIYFRRYIPKADQIFAALVCASAWERN